MRRLARVLVRLLVIAATVHIVMVSVTCFTLLLGVRMGYAPATCELVALVVGVYSSFASILGAVFLIDEWERRSPILTAERVQAWYAAGKRLLRDPLRRERLNRAVVKSSD